MSLQEEDDHLDCIANRSQPYVSDLVRFSVGTVSTLSCLSVIIALLYNKLHCRFNYRLIIYWLAAYALMSFAHVVALPVAWYESKMALFCRAIAALDTYSLWVLIVVSLFITLVMVSMALCYVQCKKSREIPSVLASLLLPLMIFWIPLYTKTYGYTSYYGCWIRDLNNSCNDSKIDFGEKLGLWFIPVLAQSLLVCVAFGTIILTLACRWCKEKVSYSSDERESLLSSHSNHYTALKEIATLFGCPVVALIMISTFLTVVQLRLLQENAFWLSVVLSTTPDISGIVAALSVGIHLLILHKKKGTTCIVGKCDCCWTRSSSVQLVGTCNDESITYGNTTDSCPTTFDPPTESEVDSTLESAHHQR